MANEVTLKDVMTFFGTDTRPMGPKEMTKEWKALSDTDKAQIKAGLSDGTFNYV